MNIKRFEKYLFDKRNHLWYIYYMVEGSKDSENQQKELKLKIELDLLDDIIHQFSLFVKGDKDFLDSA